MKIHADVKAGRPINHIWKNQLWILMNESKSQPFNSHCSHCFFYSEQLVWRGKGQTHFCRYNSRCGWGRVGNRPRSYGEKCVPSFHFCPQIRNSRKGVCQESTSTAERRDRCCGWASMCGSWGQWERRSICRCCWRWTWRWGRRIWKNHFCRWFIASKSAFKEYFRGRGQYVRIKIMLVFIVHSQQLFVFRKNVVPNHIFHKLVCSVRSHLKTASWG